MVEKRTLRGSFFWSVLPDSLFLQSMKIRYDCCRILNFHLHLTGALTALHVNFMITKAQIKLIQSLKNARDRSREGLFVVEGVKMVEELVNSKFEIVNIYATTDWTVPQSKRKLHIDAIEEWELERISSLTTPNKVLAVAKIPAQETMEEIKDELILLLEQINDPGNMGTIIRTAEWFGINRVVASEDSVDVWNPKVVQASMGSVFRMKLNSVNIKDFLKQNRSLPVYGTLLEGDDLNSVQLTPTGIIIIGNESHGISAATIPFITRKITIPAANTSGSESLNASIATAIVCYEFRKQFPV